MPDRVQIAIDRGGTFCDVWAKIPRHGEVVFKLLSVDPDNYDDAPAEGIRRVLETFTGQKIDRGSKLDGSLIEWVRMGTTVATNALLERKGKKFVYLTTKGFHHVLEIGTQARPELFNLKVAKPEVLYDEVVEIDERITVESSSDDPNDDPRSESNDKNVRDTLLGTSVRILQPLDEQTTRSKLADVFARGYSSIAVCLAHSYLYDVHETRIREIAREIGFEHIALSSEVSRSINYLKRGNSTCIDAYLTPHIQTYVNTFLGRFQQVPRVEFMKSDGGLVPAAQFRGINAILSGPAGGVVGLSTTCLENQPIIGFDMGGTSTDVSRVASDTFDISTENKTAGIENSAPQLDIHTVAAGGGLILKWENGLFHVGPESAGAHPGPACYRKGGPLTVTDANLFLGRLDVLKFPHIFGPNANEKLDTKITATKFRELANTVNAETGRSLTPQQVALGFLTVANETMARSIREITEARGYVTKNHTLVSFGGAGSQNCAGVARNLDIRRILIHKYSSVLSAYGIAVAKVSHSEKRPFVKIYSAESLAEAKRVVDELKLTVSEQLAEMQGVDVASVEFSVRLGMKYRSSNTVLQVDGEDYLGNFLEAHKREFGFNLPQNIGVHINSVEVLGVVVLAEIPEVRVSHELERTQKRKPQHQRTQRIFFDDGDVDANVYELSLLQNGDKIDGPALLVDDTQTILVDPNATATATSEHVVVDLGDNKVVDADHKVVEADLSDHKLLNVDLSGLKLLADLKSQNVDPKMLKVDPKMLEVDSKSLLADTKLLRADLVPSDLLNADPILLTVFGHRFMAIAETMGRVLQKTAISSSIKERLDFSCAIFDAGGGLVANAPHIPVHLGSMQYAIQYQHNLWAGKLEPGDVLVSNHPEAGGTHLPDLTVITPVFHDGEIVFYCASRGHHADIGGAGITAMAPNSKMLWQEGVAIKSFKLVSKGQFDEDGIVELFMKAAEYPGCSALRKINDNLSDLKAQISANQAGIKLVQGLFDDHGGPFIQYYMRAIRYNAEKIVRDFFKDQYKIHGGKPISAFDFFDDGTKVQLTLTIDGDKGEGHFDFTGTGPETYGPMNTPPSITHSCVLYVIRCLINMNIPLNQGCLTPCHITIPKNSILNPSEHVAICGSTISGQRITDVILKVFDCCAASQGCANSFGWGSGGKDPLTGIVTPGFATGEALGGGVGACDGYDGASATNVHCTNTRTTDIEVVESRTPVVITKWEIRRGSGGNGRFKGGDGAIREIEARIPLRVSILSERRHYAPYGLKGGHPGEVGSNFWYRKQKDGSYIQTRIANKDIIDINVGDRVRINTPGGGGYGAPIRE